MCEHPTETFCCAAEIQKKDIFQQSTVIRSLIDTANVINPSTKFTFFCLKNLVFNNEVLIR